MLGAVIRNGNHTLVIDLPTGMRSSHSVNHTGIFRI